MQVGIFGGETSGSITVAGTPIPFEGGKFDSFVRKVSGYTTSLTPTRSIATLRGSRELWMSVIAAFSVGLEPALVVRAARSSRA